MCWRSTLSVFYSSYHFIPRFLDCMRVTRYTGVLCLYMYMHGWSLYTCHHSNNYGSSTVNSWQVSATCGMGIPAPYCKRQLDESLIMVRLVPGCVGLGKRFVTRHDDRMEMIQAAIDLESECTLVWTDEFFSVVFSCACLWPHSPVLHSPGKELWYIFTL